ncbi:extracellular solute-binding protein [Magnetospirillum sp. SS-4]|uniref:extracellular solute-binding protein n=1 Tax=Magnetospirillum sp. SS-4 TaxID=2681465 RepID=UPI0013813A11|nr:extracellular solute-binding protein [Magnetospirillum sp. SS-4]CAA7612499.1 Spermidine/putrescine-binding periplasmic protein [Magnetospirillum sp. SS-4]
MKSVLAMLLAMLAVAAFPGGAVASELRILARASYVSSDLLEKFRRETGIRATVEEIPDHIAMIGIMTADVSGARSRFDIAFPPDHRVAELIEGGRLERIWADRLPGFWNIEDPWRSRSFDPRNEYTIPHQWGTTAFAVDTRLHRGEIDTLRLLFDPPADLAGRLGVLDDADMVQLALLYLDAPRCTLEAERLEQAARLLAPLVGRARMLSPDTVTTALNDPALALAVSWNGDSMRAREGRPSLAFAYPQEGNLVWTDVIALPRNPPNRANALKFLTFMLRPENAALQSNFNRYANMIRGSETHMLPQVLNAPELVAPWPAKVGFAASCDGPAQRRHEAVWATVKAAADAGNGR